MHEKKFENFPLITDVVMDLFRKTHLYPVQHTSCCGQMWAWSTRDVIKGKDNQASTLGSRYYRSS